MSSTKEFHVTKLNGPEDWYQWLEDLQAVAEGLQIWQYIDPQGIEELEEPHGLPEQPTFPTIEDPPTKPSTPIWLLVEGNGLTDDIIQQNQEKNRAMKLQWESEKEEYLIRLQNWKTEADAATSWYTLHKTKWELEEKTRTAALRVYERRRDRIEALAREVVANLSLAYKEHCRPAATLRGKLQRLRTRINPNHLQEGYDLAEKLWTIIRQPGSRDWDAWSHQVERAYERCRHIKAPGVDEETARRAFLPAVSSHRAFYDRHQQQADEARIRGEAQRPFPEILTLFRTHLVMAKRLDPQPRANRTNATQVKPDDQGQQPKNSSRVKHKMCPGCGTRHPIKEGGWWQTCWAYWAKHRKNLLPEGCVMPQGAIDKVIRRLQEHADEDEASRKWIPTDEATPPSRERHPFFFKEPTKEVAHQGPPSQGKAVTIDISSSNGAQPTAGAMQLAASNIRDSDSLRNAAIFDSGSNVHVFNSRKVFTDFNEDIDNVIYAGGRSIIPSGRGTATINVKCPGYAQGRDIKLHNAYLVPAMHTNIVSNREFRKNGILWDQERDILYHRETREDIASLEEVEEQYIISWINPTIRVNATYSTNAQVGYGAKDEEAQRWHRRMGHIGPEALKRLITDKSLDGPKQHECTICARGKASRDVSRKAPRHIPYGPGKAFSLDLHYADCIAYNGHRYWVVYTCMTTGMRFFYSMERKDQLPETTVQFKHWIRKQFGMEIQLFWSDNEKALIHHQDVAAMKATGTELRLSAPSVATQNGHAERSGAVIKTMERCLFNDSNLPGDLWVEVARTACYLLNRTPRNHEGEWKSPYERWWTWMRDNTSTWSRLPADLSPRVDHLRVYGCVAYPMTTNALERVKSNRAIDSTEPRAHLGYLVGYRSETQWTIWVPSLRRPVIVSANVQFDERYTYDPQREEAAEAFQEYTYEALREVGIVEIDDPYPEAQGSGVALPQGITATSSHHITVQEPPQLDSITVKMDENTSDRELYMEATPDDHEIDATDDAGGDVTMAEAPASTPRDHIQQESIHSGRAITTAHPQHIDEADEILEDNTDLIPFAQLIDKTEPQQPLAPAALGGEEEAPEEQQLPTPERRLLPAPDNSADLDISNIIESTRWRQPTAKKRQLDEAPTRRTRQRINNVLAAISRATEYMLRVDKMPPEPSHFHQAINGPHSSDWWKAMDKEVYNLEDIGTYEIISEDEVPVNIQIPLKWVYKYKADERGYLKSFKARLVVRGDQQPPTGADNYAATLAARSFRVLAGLCCVNDWETRQYDVGNAFVNAWLDEEVYCQAPPGYKRPGMCLKLRRALYGLRRSPKLWFETFKAFLERLGFTQGKQDPCIFRKGDLIVFFYVDDVVTMFPKSANAEWQEFHEALMKEYKVRDMGELKWFLGIEVIRDRKNRRMWLSQRSYFETMANKFDLADGDWIPQAPMPEGELMPSTHEASKNEIYAFQSKVGHILYGSIITRPDIAFVATKLSQFLLNPSPQHQQVAAQCIRYGYLTRDRCIYFCADESQNTLYCSSDASHGDDSISRKSSQGFLFILFGGPIMWKASKQDTVATSSTEAELISLSNTTKERIALGLFLDELGIQVPSPMEVWCDNKQTIGLIEKEAYTLHTRLRHVDIQNHWLRQVHQDGKLRVKWLPTAQMPADGLTKPLPPQQHAKFVKMLNLRGRPDGWDAAQSRSLVNFAIASPKHLQSERHLDQMEGFIIPFL